MAVGPIDAFWATTKAPNASAGFRAAFPSFYCAFVSEQPMQCVSAGPGRWNLHSPILGLSDLGMVAS